MTTFFAVTTALPANSAAAQRDILKFEAQIVENRLALISMCDTTRAERVNQYLKKLTYLPPPTLTGEQP
ncbi:hypothetical protein ACQKP8_23295 [Photobacterium alginatilyticum]|uniref:hypothetical protein n=1 Tax=Photobacterium alginatilyticum TaxID=1775171 RepID=UPI0040694157